MGKEDYTRANINKWGKLVHQAGWSYVPVLLIERQSQLGITPGELNIILILNKYWWRKDRLPYPSMAKIGGLMGRDVSTARRLIARLESKGFIRRVARKSENNEKANLTNEYDLSGLAEALTRIAERDSQETS